VTTGATVLSPERQKLVKPTVFHSNATKPTDPRIPFAAILTIYAVLGCTWFGFNRNPLQILLTVTAGCLMDMAFHWLFRGRGLLVPLSAYITSLSIALLLNYSHNYYLLFLPVFFAIGSKYLFTFQARHIFNPSLFGVVAALVLGGGLFSPAPAYQWGGTVLVAAFIVTAAVCLSHPSWGADRFFSSVLFSADFASRLRHALSPAA
jgi:Na+-transporting NADH:ubiquinone oxidoreductase subunit NqrB